MIPPVDFGTLRSNAYWGAISVLPHDLITPRASNTWNYIELATLLVQGNLNSNQALIPRPSLSLSIGSVSVFRTTKLFLHQNQGALSVLERLLPRRDYWRTLAKFTSVFADGTEKWQSYGPLFKSSNARSVISCCDWYCACCRNIASLSKYWKIFLMTLYSW